SNKLFVFLAINCGIWGLNCLLSVQKLFTGFDLSNQAISAIIMILLLLIQVYFPILDNFNPIAWSKSFSFDYIFPFSNRIAYKFEPISLKYKLRRVNLFMQSIVRYRKKCSY